MDHPKVVSHDEACAARGAFLLEEKQFTKARDELARKRRALPWTRVEKTYVFDTVRGPQSLADLFSGRSQLIVQHFMFAPEWSEGCVGCSFGADSVDGALPHVQARDASFVAVSRAPLEKLLRYRKRMGWTFDWVSSGGNDFNYDFGVAFRPDDIAAGRATYNHRPLTFEASDLPGIQRLLQGRRRRDLPHLFDLRARAGDDDNRLHVYRPPAQGPRRGGSREPAKLVAPA